jgi:GNAT superfamily N-acetyltransferase
VPLDIRPLTPDRLPDLAALFGEGGDPKWCWCSWYRVRSTTFSGSSVEEHRAVLEAAVVADAAEDRAPGLLAYRDAVPVGWVSVGPRSDYERLTYSRILAPVDDTPVWSIVCFVVGRKSRRQGVALALLDAAIDYARRHGATTLEAYPIEIPAGGKVDAALVYKGTLTMFERAGFEVVARRVSPGTRQPRPIVRLAL